MLLDISKWVTQTLTALYKECAIQRRHYSANQRLWIAHVRYSSYHCHNFLPILFTEVNPRCLLVHHSDYTYGLGRAPSYGRWRLVETHIGQLRKSTCGERTVVR